MSRGGSRKKHEKTRKTLTSLQQHPGFCAGGSSRPNGSGYPLSVPAVAHPPPPRFPDFKVLGGGKGEVKPKGRRIESKQPMSAQKQKQAARLLSQNRAIFWGRGLGLSVFQGSRVQASWLAVGCSRLIEMVQGLGFARLQMGVWVAILRDSFCDCTHLICIVWRFCAAMGCGLLSVAALSFLMKVVLRRS